MQALLNLVPGASAEQAARKSSGPQTAITTNDGVRLVYQRYGAYGRASLSGPVIVLVHGWSGSR